MGQEELWTERFGISSADLTQWKQQAGSEEELLRWCLLNGKLSESAYLEWAMKTFELPMVTGAFFTIPADQVFWDRIKDLQKWNPAFFPLAEWNDVLLIACVQPPKNFRYAKPHRFVLASPRNLQLLWSVFQPVAATETAAPSASTEAPDGLSFVGFEASSSVQIMPAVKESEPATSGAFEMPEGLSFGAETLTKTQDIILDSSANSETSAQAHETPELPDGISAQTFASSSISIDFSEPAAPAEPATLVSAKPAPILAESSTDNVVTFPKSSHSGSSVPSTLEATPLENCSSEDDLAAMVLAHVMKTFEYALIFRVDKNHVLPWKWTDNLNVIHSEQTNSIGLIAPSIFRIVSRTLLPYHGYVAASPTNEQFFTQFFQGTYPKHVTLVPVIENHELIAIVMGATNAEIAYRNTLLVMERLAEAMSRQLAALPKAG